MREGINMLRRYSVRKLDSDAIEMLAEIKAEERRELGAILEDCIAAYWRDIFEDEADGVANEDVGA
jgi:galactose-1-phosphate uridylyltransferase